LHVRKEGSVLIKRIIRSLTVTALVVLALAVPAFAQDDPNCHYRNGADTVRCDGELYELQDNNDGYDYNDYAPWWGDGDESYDYPPWIYGDGSYDYPLWGDGDESYGYPPLLSDGNESYYDEDAYEDLEEEYEERQEEYEELREDYEEAYSYW
jgi:hypothetical protein